MEENIKLINSKTNLSLYKKDKCDTWIKVADLNTNERYLQEFLHIVGEFEIKPLRQTQRTKFYYIPEKYI